MANNYVTPVLVSDKILQYMDNNIVIGKYVNRQYDKDFKGGKGATVMVVKPPKYEALDGPEMSTVQSINQGKIAVSVDTWKTVLIDLTGVDLAMNASAFEDWSKTFLEPASSILANTVDMAIYNQYKNIANFVGTPGTPPATADALAAAKELLDYNACPPSERYLALNPTAERKVVGGLTNVYNPRIVEEAVRKAVTTPISGLETFMAQNVSNHTVGAFGGTPIVNGASQVGSSVVTNGWTASAAILNIGDVITFAGVYLVNPVTKQSTSMLQTFVVTQNVVADGSGNATIPISPSIITSGAYQTVSGSPANSAAITVKTGTASTAYAQNLAFHRNALGLVMAPVPPLEGTKSATRTYKNFSLTVSSAPDIMKYKQIWRADILFGTTTFYPELACRITN